MWLGCRAGLVVGIIDKEGRRKERGYMSLECAKRTRTSVDGFAELGVVQDRLLPLGGVR